MISLTGNSSFDATLLTAEGVRQQAVSVAASQSAMNSATTTFYRTILASKIANGLDCGNELIALDNLGQTV